MKYRDAIKTREEFFSFIKYIPNKIKGKPYKISNCKESLPSPISEKPI